MNKIIEGLIYTHLAGFSASIKESKCSDGFKFLIIKIRLNFFPRNFPAQRSFTEIIQSEKRIYPVVPICDTFELPLFIAVNFSLD